MEETIETTEDTLAPVDELTFRQALAELESIVAVLEIGRASCRERV